jgi:hypothetical protein
MANDIWSNQFLYPNLYITAFHAYLQSTETSPTGNWGTFCSPTNVNTQKLGSVKIAKFDRCEFNDTNEGWKMYFKEASSITANEPCLVKPSSFSVNFEDTEGNVVTTNQLLNIADLVSDEEAVGATPGEVSHSDKGNTITFKGSPYDGSGYVPTGAYYFGAKTGKVYRNDYDVSFRKIPCGKYHAYFTVSVTSGTNSAKEASVFFEDFNGNTTAIDLQKASDTSLMHENVYNVQGQLVRRNATQADGLPAGLYIVNGKKMVVK